MKAPFAYLLEGDDEGPAGLVDLQLMYIGCRPEENGPGTIDARSMHRPVFNTVGAFQGKHPLNICRMFHVAALKDEGEERPGMIVLAVVIAKQNLMDLQGEKAASEKGVANQVRLAVLPFDDPFFEKFHGAVVMLMNEF
jgi:hypothetical protein